MKYKIIFAEEITEEKRKKKLEKDRMKEILMRQRKMRLTQQMSEFREFYKSNIVWTLPSTIALPTAIVLILLNFL